MIVGIILVALAFYVGLVIGILIGAVRQMRNCERAGHRG